jgi:hypothetical protein
VSFLKASFCVCVERQLLVSELGCIAAFEPLFEPIELSALLAFWESVLDPIAAGCMSPEPVVAVLPAVPEHGALFVV